MRGQANLPALAVALLVLSATTGLTLAMAEGAFASDTRSPESRQVATGLAERLVSADSPIATRANVLDAGRAATVAEERFDSRFPVATGHDLRVGLGDATLLSRGDPSGGATVRRVVLVERRQEVAFRPPLGVNETTLPRRTDRVGLTLRPPAGATVRTVRANDRVVLRDPAGLNGSYDVVVSRFETVTLTFETDRPLPPGSVVVRYYPARTTKAVLKVTVG